MRSPSYVTALTPAERATLEGGLRSSAAFHVRRCRILLTSAQLHIPAEIAAALGCGEQTVRTALHAFHERDVAALQRESFRPKTVQPLFDAPRTRLC